MLRRLAALPVLLLALLSATEAVALMELRLKADTRVDTRAWLRLTVTNAGGEAARQVVPTVTFEGHDRQGEPLASLAPHSEHEWGFAFDPPAGSGVFPMKVLVHWVDESHVPGSSVLVTRLRTAGAPGGAVRLSLDPHYTRGISGAYAGFDNTAATAVKGQLTLALPAEFTMHPDMIDVEVPAGGHKDVWTVIEKQQGLPGSSYAIFAVFQYDADGVHQTVVAESVVDVMVSARGWYVRLIVPALALTALLTIVYVCVLLARRTGSRAARRTPQSRIPSAGEPR